MNEAIEAFEAFKKFAFAYHGGTKSKMCYILNQCHEKTQDYSKLVRLISDDWRDHQCLGELMARTHRLDLAKKEFSLMLDRLREDPHNPPEEILQWLGDLYTSHGYLEEAVESYRQALARKPHEPRLQEKIDGLLQTIASTKNSPPSPLLQ